MKKMNRSERLVNSFSRIPKTAKAEDSASMPVSRKAEADTVKSFLV